MWLCLNNAFLSIVSKDCADSELLVRARRKGDIERVFPKAEVRQTIGNDYLFRACVSRADVKKAMAKQVDALSYDNFKDSVEDNDLHHAYSGVWSTMSRLQSIPPYGRSPYSKGRY